MTSVIATVGLPGSGKSTWAHEQLAQYPGKYKLVCKDDLRAMLDGGRWSKMNEAMVLAVRNEIVRIAIRGGKSVIVHDTNFARSHQDALKAIALKEGASFSLKTFDTPLDECIQRDLKRQNSVGEAVIRKMHDQYLRVAPPTPAYADGMPHAIIVDLDGTLALIGDRSPYDAALCEGDACSQPVLSVLTKYRYWGGDGDGQVVLCSGRQELHRSQTERWLKTNEVTYDALFMRASGDMRKDSIVKRELYEQNIQGKWNIDFVLDDRNQVVEMWRRELGLVCLQVAEGNF